MAGDSPEGEKKMKARMLAVQCERDIVAWARRQNEKVSAGLLAAWWIGGSSLLVIGLILLAGCKCCK